MPKKNRRMSEEDRVAIGLSNSSDFVSDPIANEEETRLKAVEKIKGMKPDVVVEDEYTGMILPDVVVVNERAVPVGGIRIQVKIEILNVRETPSLKAKVLFVAKRGDIFLTDTLNGEWLSVRTNEPNSVRGFVVAKFVEEVDHGKHP